MNLTRAAMETAAHALASGVYAPELLEQVLALKKSQRAMIGARFPIRKRGDNKKPPVKGEWSVIDVAKLLGIHAASIHEARRVHLEATIEEVDLILAGEIGFKEIIEQLRAKVSAPDRAKHRKTPLEDRGGNRMKLEQQRFESGLWADFRQAVELLAGLPDPAEFLEVVRRIDRSRFTETRFPAAAEWMRGFSDVHQRRKETAAGAGGRAAADDDHAGDGSPVSGAKPAQPPDQ